MSGDSGLNKRRGTHSFSAWRDADEEGARAVGSIHGQEDVNLTDTSTEPEDIRVSLPLTQNREFRKSKGMFFFLFFLMGLLNNNTYVVINTSAQDLAKKFEKDNLMPAFQM